MSNNSWQKLKAENKRLTEERDKYKSSAEWWEKKYKDNHASWLRVAKDLKTTMWFLVVSSGVVFGLVGYALAVLI